jgi:ribonuclease Z
MRTRTKVLLALLAIVALGAAAVRVFQVEISTALLQRMVDQRVGRDTTANLPDGLHVALCGTGSPFPDPTRAGPCSVVIAGKRIFVVDAGEGGARNISQMGIPAGRIEALFLTHFHSDHIDGMGPLMLLRWTGASTTSPLPVFGPEGVEAVIAGFNAAYATDNGYRTAHHGAAIVPPSGAGGRAMTFALPAPGNGDSVVVLDDGGVKVTAFRVDHGPVKPAVGYRFDYKGRSIVISGDTRPSPSLVVAAKGADLLVHEALSPGLTARLTAALDKRGQKNLAQITRDVANYHATPEEAADAAKAAGARALVLNHIVPPMPVRFAYPAFLGNAAQHFDGPITVGEDRMIFSLPVGSTKIVPGTLP